MTSNSSKIRHVFCFNCLTEERLACFLQIYKAQWGQPIKMLNDKFSLVRKHRSSNQRPWTMIFHRVKFHRSWCRLAVANSERLLRTAISMNKSLYSYNKIKHSFRPMKTYVQWTLVKGLYLNLKWLDDRICVNESHANINYIFSFNYMFVWETHNHLPSRDTATLNHG